MYRLASAVLMLWGMLAATMAAASTPEAGMLLVAREGLPDIRFRKTVVLLLQSDHQGSAGLILNRPSRLTLTEALPSLPPAAGQAGSLSYGGPVAPRAFLVLVDAAGAPPEPSQKILRTVYLTGLTQLSAWLAKERPGVRYRVFAGYAGWAPGQLEAETARGDWRIVPADARMLFSADVDGLWEELGLPGPVSER